jgi:tripartite ATP-independent transporter DctP family solute receptor
MTIRKMSRRALLRRAAALAAAVPFSGAILPSLSRSAAAAPVTLRLSSSQANDPKYANGRVYNDELIKQLKAMKLDDQIAIQFFPDNQLGQEIDVANSVKLGVIDLMVTGTSIWANLVPAWGVADLGYIFQSYEHQTRALDSGAGKTMEDMLLKGAATHVVGWAYNFGSRSVMCKTPVTDPASLAGKKIRTLPNPVITECLRLMGAAATPMAFGEIYTALQAGVLDGLEHDPPTIVASKFYETAKFYTLTEHIFSPLGIFMGDASYKKLPPPLRDGFLAAAKAAAIETRARGLAVEKEALEVMKQQGVTIAACDKEAFRARVLPLHESFVKQRPEVKPILDAIQATRT